MAEVNPYRLPRVVEPERYDLTLVPDLDNASFYGEESIFIVVHQPTAVIQLNSAELEINSIELVNNAGFQIEGTIQLNDETEVATINLSDVIQPGNWILKLSFTGVLNDKLRGFYRSTFIDQKGNEKVIATTQFQATDARRAFPCWDEPDFKAVFSITLVVDKNLGAFSNSPINTESILENGKRQVVFQDTIKMSTYLVAFVVGPLVTSEVVDVEGTPLQVACVPGQERLTKFALEVGASALRYFAEYFKIPYPSGKLDLLALPDFASGAMENLGCVTFRETALLVDPQSASRLEVERVADVVAHEIAHMWFGDLVTMKWWNGIWLNEAFATFMELLFVDQFRPDWERWTSFGLEKTAAFAIDSLTSTRPIEYPVVRPEEAQAMFDVLTYQKGAAVLRMLEQHLGSHEFATGISAYLHEHAYSNAETTDLWDGLERASEQPVRALMDSWIFQGGHPIVHVKLENQDTLSLSQQRFTFSSDTKFSNRWHIPVGIRTMINNKLQSHKLLMVEQNIKVPLSGNPDWVLVNQRSNGFYRVSYESSLLQQLVENIHALDSLERFSLASDTWAACLAGMTDLKDVINLVEKLRGDDDPNVWGALLAPLRLLDKMVDHQLRPKFESFVRQIANQNYGWLGWTPNQGESERITTLRGVIVSTLGILGNDRDVQVEAQTRYINYLSDSSSLNVNLITPVQMILGQINKREHYELLHSKFIDQRSTPQEKVNALQALANFSEPSLAERTLTMIERGQVRTQDAPYALRSMLASKHLAFRTWEWCEQHWEDINQRFPDNSIARMFEGLAAQVDSVLAERVQSFMSDHPIPQAQLLIDQTCERLRVNVAFSQKHKAKLDELFN